jgi:hypothetical protein
MGEATDRESGARAQPTVQILNFALASEKNRLKPGLQRLAANARCGEGHRAGTSVKPLLKPAAKGEAAGVPPSGGL